MYGYIVPNKDTLRASDFVLYRAFYCGICCRTGRDYGQLPRFTTNYDFSFLSALLHDYAKANIVIEEHKCVLNPIKKKAILMDSGLLDRIVAANIMLAYKKADDGVVDGEGIKYRALRHMLKKANRKAVNDYPEISEVIEKGYAAQSDVEKKRIDSIDRAADPFATLTRELVQVILNEKIDDSLGTLCYNIGKLIYLFDALDDIADDVKSKRYNPFVLKYGLNKKNFKGRKEFFSEHHDDIEFALGVCINRAKAALNELKLVQSYTLLHNVVDDGLRLKLDELLASSKKLPPPKI